MKILFKITTITFGLAVGFILGLAVNKLPTPMDRNTTLVKAKPIIKIVKVEPKNVVVSVTIKDVESYVKKLSPAWSDKMRSHFLHVVAKASDKYKISPLVFISMASVESSYRPQIVHNLAKGAHERAVGLMGIMPKMWLPELRKSGIADTRQDLFTIEASVMASAYILNKKRKQPLLKGTKDSMESALRRYFGGNYKAYTNKIASNIGAIILTKVYK